MQESIGRVATIFFAHRFALRIEAEVKFYRFLADVVNDAAFVLDVLSPSLPAVARVPALCTASACRAVCGVCGGSSKAILSAHFCAGGEYRGVECEGRESGDGGEFTGDVGGWGCGE